MMLLSIPSPGSDSLSIFGLELRFYGLMIALGVLAAVEIDSPAPGSPRG